MTSSAQRQGRAAVSGGSVVCRVIRMRWCGPAALARDDGYHGGVDMRGRFVAVYDGRDDILRLEGLAQPGEVVGTPLRKPPSSSMRFIASCEPVSMTRITRTWLEPILRVRPACSRR